MLESFIITEDIFSTFRYNEKNKIFIIINLILGVFFVIVTILIFLFIYFIYKYKQIENSFLNFIGILPAKFIVDDESFYKAIFKFGQYFY